MNRVVETIEGSHTARLHYLILRSLGTMLRPLHYRSTQRISWILGDLFSSENSVVMKLHNGGRLKVYLSDGYWTKLLFKGFEYEKDVLGILEKLVDQHSAIIDCGANIGYWSVLLSKRIGTKNRVVAIEPTIRTFSRLSENSQLNQNGFICLKAAIYDRSGKTVTIVTHNKRHAGDSISDDRTRGKPMEYHCERIETISLDDVLIKYPKLAEYNLVLKLDVEGAEVNAIMGGRECLKHVGLIIYEETPSGLVTASLLEAYPEYKLFHIVRDDLLIPLSSDCAADFFHQHDGRNRKLNLVAVRESSIFYAKIHNLGLVGI